ncbi:hypothetical protein LTR35_002920 [Friedmanniomyces endolithicus]|uniref:Uncharacterized protein n=1 Tax=Friedmanniomyces endolithicus TaxID=329885 RepID=A0AAN6JFS4_9PEZI|nr:hypothetical protein LTS00_012433 [Friedmanniomyces endolithicus]KAK0289722.1 hypothetical protein LTR35_002920 [Friedmanniomyces endolithicus]KAK0328502.1 hypothetical protein LTR82_000433 [Friedmanniomyces endolithicus]KAK1019801.1 hypothetical protein LTR54_000444 [Friedmanniomyces endolithicus]
MDPSSTLLPFGLPAPTPTLATTATIFNYLIFYTSTFVLAIASAVGAVELIARLRSNNLGAAELQSDHYARLGVGACAAILYPAAWITVTYDSEARMADGMAAMQRAVGCLGGIVGVAGLVVAAVAVRVWAREVEDDEEGEGLASGEGEGVEDEHLEMMECGGVRAEPLWERGQVEAVWMELR